MNDHQHHPTQDLLIARALGELDELGEAERAGVEAHLAECPKCDGVVRALADAMSAYRESPRPEAPARILVDLIEAQATAGRRLREARSLRVFTTTGSDAHRWLRSLAPPVAVAALLLALFLTGFWAGRRSVPEPAAPTAPIHSPVTSSPDARVATVVRHPLPDPPRIPFQPALSESP